MSETESVPLRCQACPLIFPTFDSYVKLEAELSLLESSSQLGEYADPTDTAARIEQLRAEIGGLRRELGRLSVLTVGCPGIDMSDLIGVGEAPRIGRCQSPLLDI